VKSKYIKGEKRKVSTSMMDLIKVKSYAQCVIWCLVLVSIMEQTEAGSCREAALCCNGRDSSCVVQKTPMNAIVEDVNEKPCYCDHACLKLGDCCEDFKSHCGGKWTFDLIV
jgi:Somatomedin B domain